MMVTDEKRRERLHCASLVGGRVGEQSGATGYRLDGKLADDVGPGVIEASRGFFLDGRLAGESSPDRLDRTGVDEMRRVADEAAGVVR
jgi:hypothetical protein